MSGPTKTVVILDDDKSMIRLMMRLMTILCREDIRVVAGSTYAALDGTMETVALLITDGNLGSGEMPGPAIIQKVRKQLPTLPCILHSSDGQHLQAVTPDWFTGVLQKPAILADFQKEIKRIAPHLLKQPSTSTT